MQKLPVLVTGGAGYIGSHAVIALREAGWSVAVIDNLSTGTRALVPEDVPFYEGNIADRALTTAPGGVKVLFEQAEFTRRMDASSRKAGAVEFAAAFDEARQDEKLPWR